MENKILLANKPQRNYGIDALRLVSMFMIVVLHVLGRGGVLSSLSNLTFAGELAWSIEIACYCSVNAFALISGYVGVKAKHKYSNLIYLCIQVMFYAIICSGIELAMLLVTNADVSLRTLILHILPTIDDLWYFSAYFCLFFFMPILNYVVENVPRNTLKVTAVFVFIIFCCWTQVHTKVSGLNAGYSFLWLAILYVIGGYISKYKPFENLSIFKNFLGYFVCVLVTILSRISLGSLFGKGFSLLISYTSPTVVLASIFLLNGFSKLKFSSKWEKIISLLAPLAFGIYLVHCQPFVFGKMSDAFVWISTKPVYLLIPLVLGVSFLIFAVCAFIDWIRSILFNACKIKKFSFWLEENFKKVFKFLFKCIGITFE